MTNNDMNDTQTNIERIVMQRVHLIRALRFAVSGGVFSMLVSLLALWGIGREVWVAHVLQNAPKDPFDVPRFYLEACAHTRLIVQALVVLTIAALVFVAREIVRATQFMSATQGL
jgi:hypothetical protein